MTASLAGALGALHRGQSDSFDHTTKHRLMRTFKEDMKTLNKTLATLGVGLFAVAGAAVPAQAADPVETGRNLSYTDSTGRTSTYHVWADGIDWEQNVGVLYYLDGDYFSKDPQYSQIMNPGGNVLTSMAKDANSKNLVLIAAETPSAYEDGWGYTWYREGAKNAKWVDDFATSMQSKAGFDTDYTWIAGYSGGAEHISFDLLTQDRSDWLGGGAVLIAGGGSGENTVPSPGNKDLPMVWYAGSEDGPTQTNPPEWSALGAAEEGHATYKAAGYTNARLSILQGLGHHDYDLAGLVSQNTKAAATPKPKPTKTQTQSPSPEPTETETETETPSPEPEPSNTATQTSEPTPTTTPTETPVETNTAKPTVDDVKIDSGNPQENPVWPLWTGIGAVVAAAAGLITYVVRRRKSGDNPADATIED